MITAALLITMAMLAAPSPCEEALSAQDEVIALLEAKVASLELAGRERGLQVRALELTIEARNEEIAALKRMVVLEQEGAARERRRAVWAEQWKAIQYGAVGLGLGIVVERFAE